MACQSNINGTVPKYLNNSFKYREGSKGLYPYIYLYLYYIYLHLYYIYLYLYYIYINFYFVKFSLFIETIIIGVDIHSIFFSCREETFKGTN